MPTTAAKLAITPLSLGSISEGTCNDRDIANVLIRTLEGLTLTNGQFLSQPENFSLRDLVNSAIGDLLHLFDDEGEEIAEEMQDHATECINDTFAVIEQHFIPDGCHFGYHECDGASLGVWVDVEAVKECVDFVSSKRAEYPSDDYCGEWLHISDHGNATLYVRENGKDTEIWSIV